MKDNKKTFPEIYGESRKNLYKYCRVLCGDDADDLMQQTYLKAWENFGRFDGNNPSAWLRSIARSIFLNNLRKNKPQDFIEELPEIPDSEENNPVYIAENRDRSKILMNKINNCLNPLQRLTVIFYYYDEKSVSEIADIMNCSENTVKSRLFSARKKLRQALKNDIFSFGWLAVLSLKRRLKNIKISVNARITASAVLTVTAMTAVSMTNTNTENKLPKEVIILESTSTQNTESTETASISPTSHTTAKPVSYTMPTEESLTTAFKSEFEEIAPKEDDTEPEEEPTENQETQTETEEETTMKKEIISAVTALTTAFSGTTAITTTTTAVDEVTTTYELPTETTTADESKTYLYFLKMSDEEFSEYTQDRYKEYGFGDDSIPDEIKFKNLLCVVPDFFIGDNYESEDYSIYRIFADGEATAYIPFYADSGTELDRTLSADFFGYPKDWTIQYIDGIGTFGDNIHEKLHEYRICIPNEVILDFESYVRLYESRFEVYSNEKYRKYGITGNSWIDCRFLPAGEYMSPEPVYGDANGDDNVSISDSVAIMQYIANSEKYTLTEQETINADCYDPGSGVTGLDAAAIQKFDAGIIDKLPETLS